MKKAMLILLCMLTSVTFASGLHKKNVKVEQVRHWVGHGGTLVKISTMYTAEATGCSRAQDYMILPKNHEFYDQNYAILMAALVSKNNVEVVTTQNGCAENFPVIKHLAMFSN